MFHFIQNIFHVAFYVPLYNLLMVLVDVLPGADVGLAVIALTLVVKIVLFPFAFSASKTQRKMQFIAPKLKELRELHKEDKERQMKEMMALYKEHGVNPFGSFVTILIQFPVVIALYSVFRAEVFVSADPTLLYSFVHAPTTLSPLFLGLFPIAGASIILAVIATVLQYIFSRYFMPSMASPGIGSDSSQEEMARMMTLQMRYLLPLMLGFAAYIGGGAVALYLVTSTVFGIAQQMLVNKLVQPIPVSS